MVKRRIFLFITIGLLMIFLLIGCGSLSSILRSTGGGGEAPTITTAETSSETTATSSEEQTTGTTEKSAREYKAIDFTLKSLKDEEVTLSSFAGHVVVLNFWATWCPPCREEMPDFQAAYEKYRNLGVVFLGVSVDQNRADVESYIKNSNVNYLILLDLTNEVANSYGITAIPTTFILDVNGSTVFSQVGVMNEAQLATKIDEALKK